MAILTFFTDAASGADTNGGSSAGSAKASGAGAVTNGTSTVALGTDTPNLSTVAIGDTIRIAARTDGLRSTNIFEITAVDDGLDTVTVSGSPAAASGQAWAIGGAFATIGKAEDVVRAGDTVNIKASANYNEEVTFASASVGDATTGPITFRGYTSSPGDGGMATIDAQNTRASCLDLRTPTTCYLVFYDLILTDATTSCVRGDAGTVRVFLRHCEISSSGNNGVDGGANWTLDSCYIHDNASTGADLGGVVHAYYSVFESNGNIGLNSQGVVAYKCLAYDNATTQFNTDQAASAVFFECAAGYPSSSGNGFDVANAFGGAPNLALINCSATGCVNGFRGSAFHKTRMVARNNHTDDNTTAYLNVTNTGGVTGDPLFVDSANGDYGLQTSSPLKNAGYSLDDTGGPTITETRPDIGVAGNTESVGGGGAGFLTGNKRGGKQ